VMRRISPRICHSQPSFSAMPARSVALKRGGIWKPLRMSRSRFADDLVVDGEDDRVVIRRRRSFGKLAGEAAVAEDEHLHPARGGAARRERLEGADRAVAEGSTRCRPWSPPARWRIRRQDAPARRDRSGRRSPAVPGACRKGSTERSRLAAPLKGCGNSSTSSNAASLRRSVVSSSAAPSVKSKTGFRQPSAGERPDRSDRVGLLLQRLGAHQSSR